MYFISHIVLILFLGLSVAQDIKERKLSNSRNVASLLCGLLLSVFRTDITVAEAFSGAAFALCIGIFCWLLKVFRAGDSKLFCAVGAYIGVKSVFSCFVYTLLAGALIGLPFWVAKLRKKEKGFTEIPFAPAIAVGTLLAVYVGDIWMKI
ncbi:MAG: prepilin peptidase [Lachnospiraceae bacterium]|nr:prepilin peptidase [Lachnospiraceae bacterium]MBP3570173.1 prepilin peptidase [Lachnospiraceae bacterium]